MKRKRIIILIPLVIAFLYIGIRLYDYYSPAKERPIYRTIVPKDDTIHIAYIGDSWADGHQNHNCKITNILSNYLSKPAKVSSFGISGFTSKEIYHALFELDIFKHFMENGYNYCFISAGINDCNKKMSTTYYKESMDCIIRFLLANHIHPIILEIPDYNILDGYERQQTKFKILRHLSMLINGTSMDCKQQFRDAIDELIQERGYQDKVSVIRYKSWNKNYKKDLKELYISDQMHLNGNGYSVLDSIIAKEIMNFYH